MNSTPILASRITVPELPGSVLWRARLSFSRVVAKTTRVVLITAPAGYGKTVLVSQWAHRLLPKTPVMWLALSREDSQPDSLLNYLFAAATRARLISSADCPVGHTAESLLEALTQFSKKSVLVLDNCDVIEEGSGAHEVLSYIVRNCPANVRLVLLARKELNWGLTRWQLVDGLSIVTAAELACSAEEIVELFVAHHTVVSLMKAEDIREETGGWPAALKLLLSTGTQDKSPENKGVAGRSYAKAVLAYLHDEVLLNLTREQQQFLCTTVLVDLFSLRLAAYITGSSRSESARIIEWLLNAQLIEEIEKTKQGAWYRYRPLLVNALRIEALSHTNIDITEVLRKTSRWLDKNGYSNQSVVYAERIGDFEHIVGLIEREWRSLLMGDNGYMIYRWACLVPRNLVFDKPWICCILSLAAFISDDAHFSSLCEERAVAYYTTAAGRQDPHYAEAMALISNVLSLHTRYEASREAAAIALELLPQSDYWLRMTVSQACEYARPTPDWYSYRAMLLEYLPQIVAHGHQILVANQYAFLAGAESNLGNFTVALEYVRRSFEATDKFLHPERPTFMAIHRARMTVAYHRSSIGEAELYRRQFEKVTKESYSFPSLALALACRALFCYLRADLEQVEPCLRESLRLSPYGVFGISPSVSFMRYVTDNGLMDLRKFLSEQAKTYGETREFKRLTFVSDLALGGGSRIEQLRTVVPAIENERRLDKVQGNLVLALYEEQAGEARAAEQALRQALTWAEPEQITQLFYNDYEYVLPVIERLKETAAPGSFTHRLYVHLSQLATGELSLAKADEQHLLTMRENEVVYLLVAGYTPQETAERLGISKETVRKHIVNAYRKLGVHSRTQLLLKIQ